MRGFAYTIHVSITDTNLYLSSPSQTTANDDKIFNKKPDDLNA